jgi:hypothetical protein
MATIDLQRTTPDSLHHTCVIVTWPNLANGDQGQPIELANFADRSLQVVGVFGAGGSVRIEGSLDGVNYAALTDPQGNDLNFTTAKIEAVSEVVRWLRPRVAAGDGTTALTVVALLKGAWR